jgi:predicted transcriptional regulator YheO
MNKYAVILHSLVDKATVSIRILVNSEMTARQLKTYYQSKSITISNVEVIPV